MSRIPVRIRLTLAFAAAMAAVLAAVGFLLVHHLAASLDRTLDQGLSARAADVSALVVQADTGLRDAPRARTGGASLAQVLTAGGRIFDETRGVGRRPLLGPRQLAAARTGPLWIPRAQVAGVSARLLAVPLHAQGRSLVVVVGTPLAGRGEALASLRQELLVAGPAALLLASLLGYLLAAAALRPVERLRARAGSISERRLSERLPVSPARDELGRLGETLNAMLARIESGLIRERSFVADASHELRTPLALLRAEVELALDLPRDATELRTALRSIGDEADRLSQLAEDLLLLARLDDGKLPLREEPIDLDELLHQLAARFARRASEAGRAIRVEAADTTVRADRLRLEQALANLVENALRHGAGTITLSANADTGRVRIGVRDEGAGFPPGFAARAFDRFSRAEPARSGGGAGLGLSIVQAIAAAHGADVHTDGGKGDGAEVVLSLPATAATGAGEYARRGQSDAPTAGRGARTG